MRSYDEGVAASRKDVRQRLRAAALQLYAERGFDRTTAADVALLAGVTERTFFRHFPDKREVLFDGEEALQASVVQAVAQAPGSAPLDVLRQALTSLVTTFEVDREAQQHRHRVISATPELRERGAVKRDHLTEAIAEALQRRGTAPHLAPLAAACAVAALSRARGDWLAGSPRTYADLLSDAFDDLRRIGETPGVDGAPPHASPNRDSSP